MRGGQYQVMLLLDGLRQRGHDSVLLARENAPLWNNAKAAGHLVAPALALEVWRRSRGFTIVHAHDAKSHTLAAVAARRRFVVARRVAFPIKRTASSRWKYRRAAAYLAVSEYVAGELRNAGGAAAGGGGSATRRSPSGSGGAGIADMRATGSNSRRYSARRSLRRSMS